MKHYILAALLLLQLAIRAQETPYEHMAPGTTLPSKAFEYIAQHAKALTRDDLKEKLVVLAFVSRSCHGSIESISQLGELQQSFDKKIQVILVTRDKSLPLTKGDKGADLPLITGDSYLKALFPHRTVPTHVWIDKGIVRYVAGGHNLTVANINKVLRGEPIAAVWKKEFPDFDYMAPLVGKGAERLVDNMAYYSVLFRKINIGGGTYYTRLDSAHNRVYIKIINQSLTTFYTMSHGSQFPGGDYITKARVIYDLKDSTPFFKPADPALWDQWDSTYSFSYELSMPLNGNNWQQLMQEDLRHYFPYHARVEVRPITCLALVKTGNTESLLSKGGKKLLRFIDGKVIIQASPMSTLASGLNNEETGLSQMVVDRTGIKEAVDLQLPYKKGDLAALRHALKKCNLDLVEQQVPLEMLVISDQEQTNFLTKK